MVYHLDREAVERHLHYLEALFPTVEELLQVVKMMPEGRPFTEKRKAVVDLALERATHLAIEAVTSVGGLLIDGFFMRDPGSYEDIVQILQQEGVLPPEEGGALLRLVRLRRILVNEYWRWSEIGDVAIVLLEAWPSVCRFPERVRLYIVQEWV